MHPNGSDPYGNAPDPFSQLIQDQGGHGQAPGYSPAHQDGAHQHGAFDIHAAGTIVCPSCHQASDSVKASTMMSVLLFLWVFAWWRTKKVVACASCMRKELIISTLINTVTANVLSPIVWIWHTALFFTTFGKGHDAEVIKYMR